MVLAIFHVTILGKIRLNLCCYIAYNYAILNVIGFLMKYKVNLVLVMEHLEVIVLNSVFRALLDLQTFQFP